MFLDPNMGLYLFNLMRDIFLFDLIISWDTTTMLCLHGGVIVISQVKQRKKFLMLYKYELFLTLQMHFKSVRGPLGSKQIIPTQLSMGHYEWYQSYRRWSYGLLYIIGLCQIICDEDLYIHFEDFQFPLVIQLLFIPNPFSIPFIANLLVS